MAAPSAVENLVGLKPGTRYRFGHESRRDGSATLTRYWTGLSKEELEGKMATAFPAGVTTGTGQAIPIRTTEAISLGGNDWIAVARYSMRRSKSRGGGGGAAGGGWNFTPTSETMEWYTYPFMINKEGKQATSLSQIASMLIWPYTKKTHDHWKYYSSQIWKPGTLTKFRREISTLRATLTVELDFDPRHSITNIYNTINHGEYLIGNHHWDPLTCLFNPPKIIITGNGPSYNYETTYIVDINPSMWVRQINSSNPLLNGKDFKHPVAYVPQYRVESWGNAFIPKREI